MSEKIDLRYIPKDRRISALEEEIKGLQTELSALKSYETKKSAKSNYNLSRIITLEEEIKRIEGKLSALKSHEYNLQKNRGGKNE
jgi:SMC interacting uncharacterized protein involved in chromosome segregation